MQEPVFNDLFNKVIVYNEHTYSVSGVRYINSYLKDEMEHFFRFLLEVYCKNPYLDYWRTNLWIYELSILAFNTGDISTFLMSKIALVIYLVNNIERHQWQLLNLVNDADSKVIPPEIWTQISECLSLYNIVALRQTNKFFYSLFTSDIQNSFTMRDFYGQVCNELKWHLIFSDKTFDNKTVFPPGVVDKEKYCEVLMSEARSIVTNIEDISVSKRPNINAMNKLNPTQPLWSFMLAVSIMENSEAINAFDNGLLNAGLLLLKKDPERFEFSFKKIFGELENRDFYRYLIEKHAGWRYCFALNPKRLIHVVDTVLRHFSGKQPLDITSFLIVECLLSLRIASIINFITHEESFYYYLKLAENVGGITSTILLPLYYLLNTLSSNGHKDLFLNIVRKSKDKMSLYSFLSNYTKESDIIILASLTPDYLDRLTNFFMINRNQVWFSGSQDIERLLIFMDLVTPAVSVLLERGVMSFSRMKSLTNIQRKLINLLPQWMLWDKNSFLALLRKRVVVKNLVAALKEGLRFEAEISYDSLIKLIFNYNILAPKQLSIVLEFCKDKPITLADCESPSSTLHNKLLSILPDSENNSTRKRPFSETKQKNYATKPKEFQEIFSHNDCKIYLLNTLPACDFLREDYVVVDLTKLKLLPEFCDKVLTNSLGKHLRALSTFLNFDKSFKLFAVDGGVFLIMKKNVYDSIRVYEQNTLVKPISLRGHGQLTNLLNSYLRRDNSGKQFFASLIKANPKLPQKEISLNLENIEPLPIEELFPELEETAPMKTSNPLHALGFFSESDDEADFMVIDTPKPPSLF